MKKIIFFNFRKINFSKNFIIKNKRGFFVFPPILLLILGIFIANILFIFNGKNNARAQESPDAIAIRVIPNPEHYSPIRWYQSKNFSGSPQAIIVDGYEAVRDGRTVYANAANIDDNTNELYTNIYLISYNQDAENATIDIFSRILKNWKFNTNIEGTGFCSESKTVLSAASDCTGTIGCWHFDGDFNDSSATGNNGTENGGVAFGDGVFGQAINLDGINDYITVSNVPYQTPSFTISAWIKHNSSTGEGDAVISNETYTGVWQSGYLMRYWQEPTPTNIKLDFYTSNNHNFNFGWANVPMNEWTNIAMSYDADSNTSKHYKNGQLIRSVNLSYPYIQTTRPYLYIGEGWTNVTYFHGLIDEVKIYDYAVPDSEILNHYVQVHDQCHSDADCAGQGYCSSPKARIARDIGRLADLVDIRDYILSYYNENGHYPILAAGTYLPNKTISVWPSWTNTFAGELGASLPIDPINKLGSCSEGGYNPDTCWNEEESRFADPNEDDEELNLPLNSYAYKYSGVSDGTSYSICSNMETGYNILAPFDCNDGLFNNPPEIVRANLSAGIAGHEYAGYFEAIDPDGDNLSWSIALGPGTWGSWASAPNYLENQGIRNQRRIYSGSAGNAGAYELTITVDDGRGETVSETYTINIIAAIACDDNDTDGYGVCPNCDTGHGCRFNGSDCNDNDGRINPGNEEICEDGIDNDCDGADAVCGVQCADGYCDMGQNECSECPGGGDCGFSDCCGNMVLDEPIGEECDDGDNINNDECDNSCSLTYCGDGIIQNNPYNSDFVLEQCDYRDTDSGDGCDDDCQVEPTECVTDEACDGLCPLGCLPADDPDCGCANNNSCCGQACTIWDDTDCSGDCGDGYCDETETCETCSFDCGICLPPCGDDFCDHGIGENVETCPADCGCECGDGICSPGCGETVAVCEVDCIEPCEFDEFGNLILPCIIF